MNETPKTTATADLLPVPLSHADRVRMFGRFAFTRTPKPGNPEHVTLSGPWPNKNLVSAPIPQLRVSCMVHAKIRPQFLALFDAWSRAGLLDYIKHFDGAWVSRFKRQSVTAEEIQAAGSVFQARAAKCAGLGETALSNHTWGTAFDLNADWNPLGGEAAPVDAIGTVLPLVPLAREHGFAWGGDFHSRKDPMHFEAYRIL